MALLPSGSREDVELVLIEHNDFSLVIKGKPFHHRYEGLKQYRAMDYHDVMGFSVKGSGLGSIQVYDIEAQELSTSEKLRPIFFENGNYQVIVMPKEKDKELYFYHEHPLLRQAISMVQLAGTRMLMGNLQFQNEVGLTTFEIQSGKDTLLEVTLEIFPTKLDYKKDYQRLLEEVNEEIYNLAFHFIKKTYLGASIKLDGKPSRTEFYRLITKHFNQFLQAITRIERQPHHRLEKTYIRARGDQLSKTDTTTRKYLQKRTQLLVEVDRGINIEDRDFMPITGLKAKKELVYDTYENRYVKYIMNRLIDKLDDLLDTVFNQTKRWTEQPDPELVERITDMKKKLVSKLKNPFWRDIGRLDRSVMSLVLQMAPGYRDAFQIFLTISKGLMLQGKIYQMSVKDVATLYEYWTFLKLGQILHTKYEQISQNVVQVSRDGLFVNLEANRSAQRIFVHSVTREKIILTYQKLENHLPTISQKPDTMLTIEKKGRDHKYNYVFDAKYRIDYAQEGSYYNKRYKKAGPLEEDINTMHRYRDSLVVMNEGPYERTAFGAYVLFPWYDETDYVQHHFYQSIDKVNIGGLPFLPNATALVEQFVERLIEKSPEEIQKEGILPRGTKEAWNSSLEEKVLVGLVADFEQYKGFIQNGYYEIPVKQLKKGWQEAKYIALYAKAGIGLPNGISEYGKVNYVSTVRREEEEYIRFSVDVWTNMKLIKPVHYGIATYMMTTFSLLKDAEELPELYMKTREETTLWRMLRRISDKVEIGLDHATIDQASMVEQFSFVNIKIQIDRNNDVIHLIKEDTEEKMPLDLLVSQPSLVFKKILSFL
ncbi:restriction endonuclease-like protein [Bacillus sp. V5-8f]|uniref:restriction endonuclease-like protein n=1 Tax=Bacillus sp. V5-8f TaxID=2053044 RepID=UPI000C7560BA|nr:restriction endonuclease-like protein [Bacillus sp. V5-8f]PLT32706.1 restriction endonuclease [Bacillus sp. V5-8f]